MSKLIVAFEIGCDEEHIAAGEVGIVGTCAVLTPSGA
jgi:hypothetical protein